MQWKKTLIVTGLLLCTSLALGHLNRSKIVRLKKPLKDFPLAIGDWRGVTQKFDKRIYDILDVDDSFLSTYTSVVGSVVQLYIAFYSSQREGSLIHSPKNCMPGSGWNVADSKLINLSIPSRKGQPIQVIRLLIQKGSQKRIVLYWFHSRGRVIASEYAQKYYLVMDSFMNRRTDGGFVRLITPVANDEQQSLEMLKKFAVQLFPIIDQYLPS